MIFWIVNIFLITLVVFFIWVACRRIVEPEPFENATDVSSPNPLNLDNIMVQAMKTWAPEQWSAFIKTWTENQTNESFTEIYNQRMASLTYANQLEYIRMFNMELARAQESVVPHTDAFTTLQTTWKQIQSTAPVGDMFLGIELSAMGKVLTKMKTLDTVIYAQQRHECHILYGIQDTSVQQAMAFQKMRRDSAVNWITWTDQTKDTIRQALDSSKTELITTTGRTCGTTVEQWVPCSKTANIMAPLPWNTASASASAPAPAPAPTINTSLVLETTCNNRWATYTTQPSYTLQIQSYSATLLQNILNFQRQVSEYIDHITSQLEITKKSNKHIQTVFAHELAYLYPTKEEGFESASSASTLFKQIVMNTCIIEHTTNELLQSVVQITAATATNHTHATKQITRGYVFREISHLANLYISANRQITAEVRQAFQSRLTQIAILYPEVHRKLLLFLANVNTLQQTPALINTPDALKSKIGELFKEFHPPNAPTPQNITDIQDAVYIYTALADVETSSTQA